MMKAENIFDDIEPMMAWWVDDNAKDVSDLAQIADTAIDKHIPFISVPCDVVKTFWPWIEKTDIKLMTRFNFMGDENHDFDVAVSDLATKVTTTFRQGADGVQIFVPYSQIADFMNAIKIIRNDLFFDKYVSIGIDIDEKQDIDWQYVFDALGAIKPNAVLLVGYEQKFNPNSDFAGRIFDMLQKWNLRSDLHLMFGKNMLRVSQVLRLVEKMRPEASKNIRVFIEQ
ncbi:MAG: hypothetical protein J6S80_00580 [Alphaproteobacteria bacterium]|nr:hypothetical protein [Alphaproteobacteria bacterium]